MLSGPTLDHTHDLGDSSAAFLIEFRPAVACDSHSAHTIPWLVEARQLLASVVGSHGACNAELSGDKFISLPRWDIQEPFEHCRACQMDVKRVPPLGRRGPYAESVAERYEVFLLLADLSGR